LVYISLCPSGWLPDGLFFRLCAFAQGFKVITPHTAAQQQKLQALPAGKVTLIQKDGKTYYVFPDAANNQAYVGDPKQYQAYRAASFAE
jgi:hypothetical protein